MAADTPKIIDIAQMKFSYPARDPVVDIAELTVRAGERVFVRGPSGSGKTTLLGLIGGVLTPQVGKIVVLGKYLNLLSGSHRDSFRAHHVGFVFQMFNLLPYLSLIENVVLPCRFSRVRRQRALELGQSVESEAARLLSGLGLGEQLHNRLSTELSVGQQQRVAVARALMGQPELIIADEPTSALDADTRVGFLKLLFKECEQAGSTLIFVSHDAALASNFERQISLPELNMAGRQA